MLPRLLPGHFFVRRDRLYCPYIKEPSVKANKYGVVMKARREKQKPIPMDLSGEQGTRLVLATAKRVMTTHSKVIKALATR